MHVFIDSLISFYIHATDYQSDNFRHRYCGPFGKSTLVRITKLNKPLRHCSLQKFAFIHFPKYDAISVLFPDLQPGGDCRCFVCQTRCWIQQYKMSELFRPHVNLFSFELEWRLSRELMALDIMTSFHYRSIFIPLIYSQLTAKLWIAMGIYVPCVNRFWSEWIRASKCGVFLKL